MKSKLKLDRLLGNEIIYSYSKRWQSVIVNENQDFYMEKLWEQLRTNKIKYKRVIVNYCTVRVKMQITINKLQTPKSRSKIIINKCHIICMYD